MAEKQEPFEIGGEIIQPGTRKVVRIPTSMFPEFPAFNLTAYVIHGRLPGKKLFLSSTIHGDELNGIAAIKSVLSSHHTKHLKGTLIAVPIVNLVGTLIKSRYLPDRRDLNRSFPGSETGSQASQLAYLFLNEIVKKCTHGIDLHTGSDNRTNLPQIRCDFDSKEALNLALVFGAPVILKAKLRDGSLREASESLQIPTVVFEGGEALRFNKFAIRVAKNGILRVMAHLDMIDKTKFKAIKTPSLLSPASRWVRSPNTGILHTMCDLGHKVIKGDILGKIGDSLGLAHTNIVANFDGVVVGRTQLPFVFQGDAIFNVAWVPDPEKAEEILLEFKEEIELNVSSDDPTTY
ncbi:MAG: succinylglutamate desuccinylase/aspartoacylase family protein [Alphaproteobacteria bacterium]|nr:succinylglutamate desuccinylase/aspartoacylase family protein [Alphaproteobacteria bacterium]